MQDTNRDPDTDPRLASSHAPKATAEGRATDATAPASKDASTPGRKDGRTGSTPAADPGTSAPAPVGAAPGPVALSAEGLHGLALEAFRIGNRGRLSLCEALRALAESGLHVELGFPSLPAYADTFFQLRRAEAFEYVRVARSLTQLTELRGAFAEGQIGWSAVKAITRVATVDAQGRWIDFARESGVEATLAEARDAHRAGRHTPRDSTYGLPNLDQKLVLRLPRSDMEKVRSWLERVALSAAEKTGADEVSVEQALLFLCELAAQSTVAGRDVEDDGSAKPRQAAPRAQVVYQACHECRRARVGTREGFVEVTREELERYEGSAEPVVIDGPTPPRLRRQVLAREAVRCGNPRCLNRAAHCHHIRFRSQGGKSELANEVAVCATCHALVHAGLLRVRGDANDALTWTPVVDSLLTCDWQTDRTAATELPVLELSSSTPRGFGPPCDAPESAIADSVSAASLDHEALAGGLVRLGVSVSRSRQVIAQVVAALPNDERNEATVLRRSLAAL